VGFPPYPPLGLGGGWGETPTYLFYLPYPSTNRFLWCYRPEDALGKINLALTWVDCSRQRQGDTRRDDGCHRGLELYAARLAPHLRQLIASADLFFPVIQIARPSRSQSNSGLLAPLKKAQCRAPEQG
jgi:hypothetical protein